MNSRIRIALGDAMALLKTADVTGATAAIQRALAGKETEARARPLDGAETAVGVRAPLRRRLGDVIKTLQDERRRFAETARQNNRQSPDTDDAGERFISRLYRSAAGSVTYKLHLPENPDRELALVLMLHGCTQDSNDFARGTRMNQLSDEFGLVVAYPYQPRSANAQGCWNWFDVRHQQRGAGEPAVLAGLARELAAEFGIDAKRVFAAGLSAGGAMADVLATTYPDVFAAVGIHSGLPHGAAKDVVSAFAAMKGNAKSHVRVSSLPSRKIIFHGDADKTVHPTNGEQVLHHLRSMHPRSMILSTSKADNGRKVTRTLLKSDTGASLAEHWLVHGAGHAWSGGDSRGSFTDAKGPDATREMLRFFLQN